VNESRIQEILRYWFGDLKTDSDLPEDKSKIWFRGGKKTDDFIRKHFQNDIHSAAQNKLDDWKNAPQGCLALIILLDQFPRNIYRDFPESFAQDAKALELSLWGIKRGYDVLLKPIEKSFFYMPLIHSEDRSIQTQSLHYFKHLTEEAPQAIQAYMKNGYDYAVRHAEIIERFGRFPHRNEILGRESTSEELQFLEGPNSSFA